MCGVIAFFGSTGNAAAYRDKVADALECLHHRGPDETGVEVVDDDVVFAHKRLAIIDVADSHEPLPYADGRYLLTFNGEIYNYVELRDELVREHGARFATAGDAEVIVAAYHVWGAEAVHRLRGMFAFVIWDRQRRQAFGARDPYGIKPLHYLRTPDGVFLASEKKALLPFAASAGWGDAGVDAASLSHYLTLQYVPEPHTLHRGIERIGSGECLTWTPGGTLTTERWYRPTFRTTTPHTPERLYERIRETLRDSVRVHLRSDVPVGAFLSSGIDSTAIVALAREFHPNILTFTVGYDVAGYSELDVARRSAR
jgi:asparagine synthase (glutamine-hydrolysing)